MTACALTVCFCLVGQSDPSLEELIAAHEATMAKVQVIVVESDLYRRPRNLPEEFERRDSWAKDASRVRKRFAFAKATLVDGSPLNDVCADLLDDGKSVRMLVNWDERRRAAVPQSSGLRGELLPPDSRGHTWFLDPSIVLLQDVQPKMVDRGWSASEYLRAGANVKLLPSVEILGHKAVPVSIDHPDTKNGGATPGSGVKSTIYFAPELGGIVLKQVHDYPAGASPPMRMDATAVEFENVGGKIILPSHVKIVTTVIGPPRRIVDEVRVVARVAINGDVPDNAFNFRFPKGTIVTEASTSGLVEHVWGENDQPAESRSPRPPIYAYPLLFLYLLGLDGRAMSIIALGLGGLIIVYGTTRYLRWRQRPPQPQQAVDVL